MRTRERLLLAGWCAACLGASAALAQPPKQGTPEEEKRWQEQRDKAAQAIQEAKRAKQEYEAAHPLYPNDFTNVGLQRLEQRLARAAEQGDHSDLTEGLRALEQYWNQAVAFHNLNAIARIEAEEFTCTDPSGAVTHKKDDLEVAQSGALQLAFSKLEGVEVNVYGDTAVLTGRTNFSGNTTFDLAISGSYRWTDVFIRRDGRWQAVNSQATNIAPIPGNQHSK